jgi:integrase
LEISDLRQAGLVLRVTSNGARSFAFRYRHPATRKTLRATIGTYPATSLEAARKRAREMATQVADGKSPIEIRLAERQSAPARTFEALAQRYLVEYAERRKRPHSVVSDKQNLRVYILPKWGWRDYRTIRRADVIELIEGIISAGKHPTANRVHACVSGIFSFAIDCELLEANPATRLKKRGIEKPRQRVLDDDEIRSFWNNCIRKPVTVPVGLALRLALLTAARASEVAEAPKEEFQNLDKPEEAVWLIPGKRTKNGRDHCVPLPPLAVQTIEAALELTADNDAHLFPSRLGRGPITRIALLNAMKRLGLNASPHDLRRTLNTRFAQMGVAKEVRNKCLNHVNAMRDPESRHYNVYEFERERRAAFNHWAEKVATIVGGRS